MSGADARDIYGREAERVRLRHLLAALRARDGLEPHRRTTVILAAIADVRLDVALEGLGRLEKLGEVTSEIVRWGDHEHMSWKLVDE